MTITPEQARELLDNSTSPGPWMLNPQGCILVDDGTDNPPGPQGFIGTMWKNGHPDEEANGLLMAAAPDMAETIAGMHWRWGIERDWKFAPGGRSTLWFKTEAEARKEWSRDDIADVHPRLVRLLVSDVEVVEGE